MLDLSITSEGYQTAPSTYIRVSQELSGSSTSSSAGSANVFIYVAVSEIVIIVVKCHFLITFLMFFFHCLTIFELKPWWHACQSVRTFFPFLLSSSTFMYRFHRSSFSATSFEHYELCSFHKYCYSSINET